MPYEGRVTAYNVPQAQFIVAKRMEAMTVAMEEQNRGIQELGKIFRALLDRIDRMGSSNAVSEG